MDALTLKEIIAEAHDASSKHGWWDGQQMEVELVGVDEKTLVQALVPPNIPEKLMLMVSELSEALEEYRVRHPLDYIYVERTDYLTGVKARFGYVDEIHSPNDKPEGIPIEIADVVIRLADFCGHYGIDLERAIRLKLAHNKTRPHRHGDKKC